MRKNCVQQNGTPLVPLYGQFLGNLNFQEIWICRFKLGCKGARLAPLLSNWNFPSHFTMDAKLLGQHPYAQMCNPPCSLFRSADAHDNWSISFCGPVWEGPTQRHPPSVLCVEDWILAINSPLFPLSSSPLTFLPSSLPISFPLPHLFFHCPRPLQALSSPKTCRFWNRKPQHTSS